MTNWLARLTGETQARLLGLLRRSRQSIAGLARALRLTDNAVRMHIAALRRDGIVEDVGTQRDTGGKPARLYGLTREGEELFPKASAPSSCCVPLGRRRPPARPTRQTDSSGWRLPRGRSASSVPTSSLNRRPT